MDARRGRMDHVTSDGFDDLPVTRGRRFRRRRADEPALPPTTEERTVVYLVDLDGFRLLNDGFGREGADAVLEAMAQRIPGAVRAEDTVRRVGPDEFSILCERVATMAEVSRLARRLLNAMEEPFELGDQQFFLGARVGIAIGGPRTADVEGLTRDADTAMQRAREYGNTSAVFDASMRASAKHFLATASDLRHAVSGRQLRVEYQPIVALPDGRLAALEALVRWIHPRRGLVSPAEFIPVAEQSGLIPEIGEWVLQEAATAAVRWARLGRGGAIPRVSVNVSAPQLADPDFVYTVTRLITTAGLPPDRLILEVTESAVMENLAAASESLRLLSRLGAQIALDDFGAGSSSLSQLRELNWVDILKIDKSFLAAVGEDEKDMAIVRTVVELAHALDMSLVAEGVETEEHAAELVRLGCDHAQGWYFGRPLRPTRADSLVVAGGQMPARFQR
jgi:diguanylate cyclase (GGDEF)-like protein